MFPYKVSVVIPVYNKEKYISQCLDSLMNQTLSRDSFEILCINDGSTDRSADIIKKHISTAKRMSGIHLAMPVFSKGYRPKQGKAVP